jgi:hypothetical protein
MAGGVKQVGKADELPALWNMDRVEPSRIFEGLPAFEGRRPMRLGPKADLLQKLAGLTGGQSWLKRALHACRACGITQHA